METAAENVGRQFFKKQLNIGSKQGRTNPANFIKHRNGNLDTILKIFLGDQEALKKSPYQLCVVVWGNHAEIVPAVGKVLSSREK